MLKLRGFTLIETIIFIVVLGISLGSIVSLFLQSATSSHYPYDQQRAIAIANTYMDEILRKRWDENVPFGGGCVETGSNYCNNFCAAKSYPDCGTCLPNPGPPASCIAPPSTAIGPDGLETRANFDDIDDYDGLADATPNDANGTPVANYAGYSVSVSVTAATPLPPVPAADVKKIVVTVSRTSSTDSYELTAYKVNH
jgi:MSHA pilin protein MshD